MDTLAAIATTDDDRQLVEGANAGDRAMLDALLRRHHDRIYTICRRIAGNDADAADACQEAMLAIVRGLPRFDGRAAFTTWMHRVVTNACLDELRRRRRRPLVGLPPGEEDGSRARPSTEVSFETTIADRMLIDAALGDLSPEFRAPVVLRDVCEMSYAEIAEILDLRPGTVRSRIARARRAVADALAGNRADPGERPSPRS